MRSIKWEAIQDAAIDTVGAVCLASIIVALGYRRVSFGTVVAFSAYLAQFFEPISLLAQRYTLVQGAMAGAERVFGLLENAEADRAEAGGAAGQSAVAVAFEDVTFAYKPSVPVLSESRFAVRAARRSRWSARPGRARPRSRRLYCACTKPRGVVRVFGDDVFGWTARAQAAVCRSAAGRGALPRHGAENVAAGSNPIASACSVLDRIGALDLFHSREKAGSTRQSASAARTSRPGSASSSRSLALCIATPDSDFGRSDGQHRQRHRVPAPARAGGAAPGVPHS